MKHQQPTQSERDAHPPQSCMGLSKNHPPQDGLDTQTNGLTETKTQQESDAFAQTFCCEVHFFSGARKQYTYTRESQGTAESLLRRWSWMQWRWPWPRLKRSSVGEPWRRRSTWQHCRWTSGLHTAAAGGCGAANTMRWESSSQLGDRCVQMGWALVQQDVMNC